VQFRFWEIQFTGICTRQRMSSCLCAIASDSHQPTIPNEEMFFILHQRVSVIGFRRLYVDLTHCRTKPRLARRPLGRVMTLLLLKVAFSCDFDLLILEIRLCQVSGSIVVWDRGVMTRPVSDHCRSWSWSCSFGLGLGLVHLVLVLVLVWTFWSCFQ